MTNEQSGKVKKEEVIVRLPKEEVAQIVDAVSEREEKKIAEVEEKLDKKYSNRNVAIPQDSVNKAVASYLDGEKQKKEEEAKAETKVEVKEEAKAETKTKVPDRKTMFSLKSSLPYIGVSLLVGFGTGFAGKSVYDKRTAKRNEDNALVSED